MPTRLPVLLHRRKSAAAGAAKPAQRAGSTTAPAAQRASGPTQDRVLIWRYPHHRLRISRRFHGLSTRMARKSLTLVKVGPGREQVAQALEKACGIVVGKKRGRIEAEFPRPRGGVAVHEGARRVLGRARAAVGAVGVGGERRDAVRPGQCDRERQRVFLVRPAAALAADRDGQFAARQDRRRGGRRPAARALAARARPRPRALRLRRGRRGRRTRSRPRARPLRRRGSASAGRAIRRNSRVGEGRIAGLRAFVGRIVERARHRLGHVEPEARNDRARIGERRWIRHGRARADHRRIVARHVGDRERHDRAPDGRRARAARP